MNPNAPIDAFSPEPISVDLLNSLGFGFNLSIINNLILVAIVAFVFYYFLGEKKKFDDVKATFLTRFLNVYALTWVAISIAVLFAQLVNLFTSIFTPLVDLESSQSYEFTNLAADLIVIILVALWGAAHFYLQSYLHKEQKDLGTFLPKFYLGVGLFYFSIVIFQSITSVVNEVVVNASFDLQAFLTIVLGLVFVALVAVKSLMIVKMEK